MGDLLHICELCHRARASSRVSFTATQRTYKVCRRCLISVDEEGVVTAL